MIFDHPPAELPVATLRPRELGPQLLLDAREWVAAKWAWLRPRSIPVAVAFAGMLGVLASASYLRDFARQTPEQLEVRVIYDGAEREPNPAATATTIEVAPLAGAIYVHDTAPAIVSCGAP